MSLKNIAYLILPLILVLGCRTSKELNTLVPEDKLTPDDIKVSSTSFMATQLRLSWGVLNNLANDALQGVLYQDNKYDNDNLKLSVQKIGEIVISGGAKGIQISIPLKFKGSYRYGASVFGVNLSDEKAFQMAARIKMSSSIRLDGWKLVSQVKIDDIQWIEKPEIQVAGQQINTTFLVNNALKFLKPEIEKKLGDALNKGLDIKSACMQYLTQLTRPILVDGPYKSWIQLEPLELFSNQPEFNSTFLSLNLGMSFKSSAVVGIEPEMISLNDISLRNALPVADKVKISLASTLSYAAVGEMLSDYFVGKTYASGKNKVKIEKVAVSSLNREILLELDLSGSVNGTVFLTALPILDSTKNELHLEHLNFTLDSKNKLVQGAAWLLKTRITNHILEQARYPLSPILDQTKSDLNQKIKAYAFTPTIVMYGHIGELKISEIALSKKGIHFVVDALGTMLITSSDLK